jgi:hypothetical protein
MAYAKPIEAYASTVHVFRDYVQANDGLQAGEARSMKPEACVSTGAE